MIDTYLASTRDAIQSDKVRADHCRLIKILDQYPIKPPLLSPVLPVRPEAVSASDAGVRPPPGAAHGARGNQARGDGPEPAHTGPAGLSGRTLKRGVNCELILHITLLSHPTDWSRTVSFKVEILEVVSNRVHKSLEFLLGIKVWNEVVKVR